MKKTILMLLAGSTLLFSGCANSTGRGGLTPEEIKALTQATVQLGIGKVVKNNPTKAGAAIAVAHAVREIASGNGVDTVDLLLAAVQTKINFSKLAPEDQAFANILLTLLGNHLKAQLGGNVLTSDKLALAGEIAGWIEDAARLAAPPAIP